MQLFIEPVDVWLFRSGRSFNAGDDHHAASMFPPFPSVVQGVIRSHHLVEQGVELTDQQVIAEKVGTATNFKDLHLRGPIVMKKASECYERYYPAPVDAVTVNKETHTIKALTPCYPGEKFVHTNAPTPMLLWDEDEPQKGEKDLWLTEDNLKKYLAREEVSGVKSGDLFQKETRFGIQRDDDRRATTEGHLYEVEYIRPCQGVGLWLDVVGLGEWNSELGLLRMGGEGRGGYFTQLNKSSHPFAHPNLDLPEYFKLYFATPTYFDGGWQPKGGNWSKYFTGPVTLQAAAVGRYLSLGGYDWAKSDHKPAYRYVPAGSIYYFKAKDGSVRLIQNWLCDPAPGGGDIGQLGFGQVISHSWTLP